MDPFWLCLSKLKRRRFDECVEIADTLLSIHGNDAGAWIVKTYAQTESGYVDDSEMEEQTLEETVINEEMLANAPRPGTSLRVTTSNSQQQQTGSRPQTARNRPLTGYVTSQQKPGTSSLAVSGRFLRIWTSGSNDTTTRMTTGNTAIGSSSEMSKAFYHYVYYILRDYKKGLEIASQWTEKEKFEDWFWKVKLAQCYYKLQMYRESEKQLLSVLKHGNTPCIEVYLTLGKVYQRLDQPNKAMQMYSKAVASPQLRVEKHLLLAHARVEDAISRGGGGGGELLCEHSPVPMYKSVLRLEPSCVEALACLATHYFYEHQPEMALRLYHYLLQMGVQNSSLFNNIGLCCFYSGQYDMCFPCFNQALLLCEDSLQLGQVWYNISHIAIALGDLTLAYHTLKIAVAHDPAHAEAWNNLGVIQWKLGLELANPVHCNHCFQSSALLAPFLFEPLFNAAFLAFKQGNCCLALHFVSKSLAVFPQHNASLSLRDTITHNFFA